MLNLKKLEEKLDKALSQETSESLNRWLSEKRKKSLINYLGAGKLEEYKSVQDWIYKGKKEKRSAAPPIGDVALSHNEYCLAA